MNAKRRFRRIALFLAAVIGASCAYYSVTLVAGEYSWAQSKLSMYQEGVEGWEACRKMKPEFYQANSEAVSYCLSGLNQAQDNFWVNLPRSQLVGLCALVGMVGAVVGFAAAFTVLRFGGLAICEFVRRLVLNFRDHVRQQAKRPHCQHWG